MSTEQGASGKKIGRKRRWEDSTPSRVAVIGGDGSFTSLAARRYFVESIELKHCSSFDSIFDAIDKGDVEYGVLPIENSDLGTIRSGIDKLVQKPGIHIVGETYEREKLCLCALPDVEIERLETITSHAVALEQCSDYLRRIRSKIKSGNLKLLISADTTAACEEIRKNNLKCTAAIASAEAAKKHGLKVLVKDMTNDMNNETRFVVVAKSPISPCLSCNAKTSLVFAFDKDEPGLLFKALGCFSLREISVLQVGMRPAARASLLMNMKPHWEYITYVDIEGTTKEKKVLNALKNLEELTSALRVLGSYERGVNRHLEAKKRLKRSGSALVGEVGGM